MIDHLFSTYVDPSKDHSHDVDSVFDHVEIVLENNHSSDDYHEHHYYLFRIDMGVTLRIRYLNRTCLNKHQSMETLIARFVKP